MSKPSNFSVFVFITKILFALYFIWRGASHMVAGSFSWAHPVMVILGVGFLVLIWFDPDRQAMTKLLFSSSKKRGVPTDTVVRNSPEETAHANTED